jgi:hypothetical protein
MGKHVIYFKGGLKSINATSGSNRTLWLGFSSNVSLDNNKILTLPKISATRKDLRNTRTIHPSIASLVTTIGLDKIKIEKSAIKIEVIRREFICSYFWVYS